MGDGGGHRAGHVVAETGDEAVHDRAGAAMAFDEGDLADVGVTVHRDDAVLDGQIGFERLGGRLVLDNADHAGADCVRSIGGLDVEICRGEGSAHVDALPRLVRPREIRFGSEHLAVPRDDLATRDHGFDGEGPQVGGQHAVGAAAGRDGAEVALHAEMGGGVDRGHLERDQRVEAAFDGVAHDAVHVAVVDERAGMAIVGAEDEVARIETLFGHGGDLGLHVVPGAAETEHGAHALADAHDGVGLGGAFVIVGGAAGGIGAEIGEVGAGVMAADGLAGGLGRGDLAEHFGITRDHAGEVHHLAQAYDVRPGHRLGDVLGAEFGAGRLEARRGGGAGGHLDEDVDGLREGLVVHQADALEPHDIGDLVGVDEHAGGAVGGDGADEFGDGQHAAFDMHVPVAKAGDEVAALGVDDLRVRSDEAVEARAAPGEAAGFDGDVAAGEDLAGMDVDPGAVADHQIGGGAAGGDGDEIGGDLGPGADGRILRHGSGLPFGRVAGRPSGRRMASSTACGRPRATAPERRDGRLVLPWRKRGPRLNLC